MYEISYTKRAINDIPKIKTAHLDQKVKQLIEIIKNNPFQTPPRYEKHLGNLSGAYSRRINIQHRLVYEVYEEKMLVRVLSIWTHYER